MRRLRVLVVDDSAVVRRLVASAVAGEADMVLAGTADHGRAALDRLASSRPDVVTLDVEMPVLDGIATLKELRRTHPELPVLMLSSHTQRGALATLDALAAGASDFVTKPVAGGPDEARVFVQRQVLPRLRALAGRLAEPQVARPVAAAKVVEAAPRRPAPSGGAARVEVVAIGVSTGGPAALERVLPRLPRGLSVPVVVVQHMPAMFTRLLAQRLDALGPLPVREAEEGATLAPGAVWLAAGGRHLALVRRGTGVALHLDDGPAENSCRPAADVLFRAAADVYGPGVLAVVLTGMGRDGVAGCEQIRSRGGAVLVQDRESAVVWGMPGAVAEAGLADAVVPLDDVALDIAARVERGRRAALLARNAS